jgi:hypothetical protein
LGYRVPTASQAIKLANELRSIDKEVNLAELKLKVAELTSSLADLKLTLTDAKSDAGEKDEEIIRLNEMQRRLVDDTVELYGYRYRSAMTENKEAMAIPCATFASRKTAC